MVIHMDDELLSIVQLAEYLGVHRWTLYRWKKDGIGPTPIKVGGAFRYRRSEVEAWLKVSA